MEKPKFTKKHYEAIADKIRNTTTRTDLIEAFIRMFDNDNTLFNEIEFRKASGLIKEE